MPKINIDAEAIVLSSDAGGDTLESAINLAIGNKKSLVILPGTYDASEIYISDSIHIRGIGGTVIIQSSGSTAVMITVESSQSGTRISDVTIEGCNFDGNNADFPTGDRTSFIRARNVDRLVIEGCFFGRSRDSGIYLSAVAGRISGNEFYDCRTAISAAGSVGLVIDKNYIRDSKDNGINLWQPNPNFDGTVITGNRIFGVDNDTGGSGQFGNAIIGYEAHNIIVSNNVISGVKYSGIRFNVCTNSQIIGNNISNTRETAIFVEAPDSSQYGYTGVVVQGNILSTVGNGISVVNPNYSGRRVTVTGNSITDSTFNTYDEWATPDRNPAQRYTITSYAAGVIAAGADIVVANNVVENCQSQGVVVHPLGTYDPSTQQRRDQNIVSVLALGNIMKQCQIGIGYNEDDDRGYAEIAENIIIGSSGGSVVPVYSPSFDTHTSAGFLPKPYERVAGSADQGNATSPITDRISFSRNKALPLTA
ncbi:TIGR03808 family TAT-translocated repetitive protein [Methylobacterium sp. EM32]|uniref:TIGR03808 family TAT-translocated repetitive protein n=1 Tax=Methylobacterium sp. EM32 TaxID=3163481 RepID=UPI0033A4EBBE